MKEIERVNYSNYKADLTINIDKYINESKGFLSLPLMRALQGKRSLIISPTGSGKTYSVINLLKDVDQVGEIKSIFIVPNSINVEQIKAEYNIPGAFGDIPVLPELSKGNVIVMTWDKFIQIDDEMLKDYIVVLDEVHQTYIEMFRLSKINKLYEKLAAALGQIHITATPNKLNFNDYSYILEYKQNIQTKYNVKLYNKVCDNTVMKIAKEAKKFALLKDDTSYLNFIKESVENKKVDVITSNTRNLSPGYKEIVSNSTMKGIDGICNTSVLMAGVNIYDQDITDIIIMNEKDIATIKQYVARFRDLKEVNVHIFNTFEEESKVYDIEWLVTTRLNEVTTDIEYFNKKNHNETFIEQLLEISPIRLNTSQEYYWSNEQYKYIVNEVGIRNTCYTRYYTKADSLSFKILLEEYFPNIEIINLDDPDNTPRKVYNQITSEEKKSILEELEANKSILVGAIEILTDKISNKTLEYLKINNMDAQRTKEQLADKQIDKYILTGNISKIVNLYTKYVIENKYNYELAWCIANKGNRARGKLFGQLNNIIYRQIEEEYPALMRYVRIEDRLYSFILGTFKPGKAYTEEHLKLFIEAAETQLPDTKLTTNKLGELLSQIYSIDARELNSVEGLDFIYNKIYISNLSTNKKKRVNTIKSFLTIEDVIQQNKLSDISLKVLENLLGERIEAIRKEAKEITELKDLFIG